MSPTVRPAISRRGLLGGCAAGLAATAGCSTLTRDCPTPSAPNVTTDWAHRFHDVGNTNAAPEGPDALDERWTVRVGARLTRPLIAGGTVYTTAIPEQEPYRGHVLAIDAETGEGEWEVPFGGESTDGTIAAVVEDTVYLLYEERGPDDRWVLVALDTGDGGERWRFTAREVIAVVAAGDVVYVSERHGSVMAIAASSGEVCARYHPGDGLFDRWLSSRTPVGRPAFGDGAVFTPTASFDTDREDSYYDHRIVAFDASGGGQWTAPIKDALFIESLATDGERVYVPVTERFGDPNRRPGASKLLALDAADGSQYWTESFDSGSVSPVAVLDETVVVSGDAVRALGTHSGEGLWSNEHAFGTPVIAGERVYARHTVGDFVDTVVELDLKSGEATGAYTFDYQVNRPPVVADSRVFVRSLEYDDTDTGSDHVADRIHALW